MSIFKATERAGEKLKEMAEKKSASPTMRISVVSGGCSGNKYKMAFDDRTEENDTIVSSNGARFLIDKESMSYLDGAEIDYFESLEASGFKINNPNAKGSCGCGKSFS